MKKVYFTSIKFNAREKQVNNHTSKINVFPVLHTFYFSTGGSENGFFYTAGGNKMQFMSRY